jgi:hypothetical protein
LHVSELEEDGLDFVGGLRRKAPQTLATALGMSVVHHGRPRADGIFGQVDAADGDLRVPVRTHDDLLPEGAQGVRIHVSQRCQVDHARNLRESIRFANRLRFFPTSRRKESSQATTRVHGLPRDASSAKRKVIHRFSPPKPRLPLPSCKGGSSAVSWVLLATRDGVIP